ncbi:hypothetical protein B0H14DRAFT_2596852 [Mycena olivaceomarginata]|nr:hypothetical protein B0H14DRAFT_2596852 [Mycena olivaceomarginata]
MKDKKARRSTFNQEQSTLFGRQHCARGDIAHWRNENWQTSSDFRVFDAPESLCVFMRRAELEVRLVCDLRWECVPSVATGARGIKDEDPTVFGGHISLRTSPGDAMTTRTSPKDVWDEAAEIGVSLSENGRLVASEGESAPAADQDAISVNESPPQSSRPDLKDSLNIAEGKDGVREEGQWTNSEEGWSNGSLSGVQSGCTLAAEGELPAGIAPTSPQDECRTGNASILAVKAMSKPALKASSGYDGRCICNARRINEDTETLALEWRKLTIRDCAPILWTLGDAELEKPETRKGSRAGQAGTRHREADDQVRGKDRYRQPGEQQRIQAMQRLEEGAEHTTSKSGTIRRGRGKIQTEESEESQDI